MIVLDVMGKGPCSRHCLTARVLRTISSIVLFVVLEELLLYGKQLTCQLNIRLVLR